MQDLSIASQIAFGLAAYEAQMLKSKYIDSEQLFLGLCKVEDVLRMGKEAFKDISDADWIYAREEIVEFRDNLLAAGFDPKAARRRLRKIIYESQEETGEFSGHRTPRCREVFAIAERLCQDEAKEQIQLKHLFLAILGKELPLLDILFLDLSIDKDALLKAFEGDIAWKELQNEKEHPNEVKENENHLPAKSKTPYLDRYGRDLTRLAKEGKLLPCIGRKEEMRKVAQILVQKRKNNPILVGDAGVGKTCIVEGLAQRIIEPDASPNIRNFRIIELDMGSLVAGTKYRGEFEERLEMLIKEASSDPNIVLFIDEFHTVVGAGAVSDSSLDASNILKPALSRGTIRCIGATTTAEYRKYIEKDSAFERRFQIVWVDEPTREEAILILKGLKPNFEKYHGLTIPDEVIEKAVELSMRYLTDFRLPDKAIDIIDQACARKVLTTISPVKLKENTGVKKITLEDIAKVVSERCRIPIKDLTTEEGERLLKMEEFLSKRVFGQDNAIREVSETVRSAKAGLKGPNKPVGVFLFLGSTGVGKTELAKAIAEYLFYDEKRLITFDMSEYQEKFSISKLIGAPPGYVGYDEEGQLTSKVRTNPYSVILFDEIEKACPEVFDLFLQIFDEGRLTDAHGRRVNFSEAVIILTSNVGTSLAKAEKRIGFENLKTDKGEGMNEEKRMIDEREEKWSSYTEQILQAINTTFRPEFLNRIQKKIIFYPLSRETVKLIINKIAEELNQLLSSKGIEIVLSDSAIDFLMEKGYNENFGAREMKRTFEQHISEPLSQMLLKGKVKSGQVVKASAPGDAIRFEIT
jgi:ATP-dependent Clp protease ATP-binding subunit ClpC